MQRTEIRQLVKTILVEDMDLNLSPDQVGETVSFLDDGLALDSISLAEFIDVIENRFSIRIQDEDLDSRTFASMDSVVALIGKRLEEANAVGMAS